MNLFFDIMAFFKSPYAVGAVVVGFLVFWYWFICNTSQEDRETPIKRDGHLPGDACPNCSAGSLEKIDKPHKLVCSNCKKTVDGFHVPGIQM